MEIVGQHRKYGAELDSTCITRDDARLEEWFWASLKGEPTINNKPSWFERVEKMVYNTLQNPIAPIGAALYAEACQQNSAVNSNTNKVVLDLVTV